MTGFELKRLGVLMTPQAGNPLESDGVLNPAAARGPDGQLYIFPRLVAEGNFSRIGVARVLFDKAGDPTGVERMGVALEPEADYELRPGGSGGCEDPRITFFVPLQRYVMTYTAFSPVGPRIALAISEDLIHWRRIGLATFNPYDGIHFDGIDNKDASIFPLDIPNPSGKPALALLHRPLFPGTRPEETARRPKSRVIDLDLESIWISYCHPGLESHGSFNQSHFTSHHRLASPVSDWERLKIGSGTPPVLTEHGWLVIYHGVCDKSEPETDHKGLTYSAGVMVLSRSHPRTIRYRSPSPILTPELPLERNGIVANVVFPTGIDRRDDIGRPDRFDVYYGMADNAIGVATLELPKHFPSSSSPRHAAGPDTGE